MERRTRKRRLKGRERRAIERERELPELQRRSLDGDEREIMKGKKALGFFLEGREGD